MPFLLSTPKLVVSDSSEWTKLCSFADSRQDLPEGGRMDFAAD
jgi:hypothetical protein